MGASRSGNCRAQAIDPRRGPAGLRDTAFLHEFGFPASHLPEWGGALLSEAMNDEARALRLSAWIRGLAQAPAQDHGGVELIPLRIGRATRTRELLLREALSAGVLELRERGAGADEVEAVNRGGEPVLILEGQPLQVRDPDRVAAGSIFVPPLAVVSVAAGPVDPRRSRVRAPEPGRGQGGDGVPDARRGRRPLREHRPRARPGRDRRPLARPAPRPRGRGPSGGVEGTRAVGRPGLGRGRARGGRRAGPSGGGLDGGAGRLDGRARVGAGHDPPVARTRARDDDSRRRHRGRSALARRAPPPPRRLRRVSGPGRRHR